MLAVSGLAGGEPNAISVRREASSEGMIMTVITWIAAPWVQPD